MCLSDFTYCSSDHIVQLYAKTSRSQNQEAAL
jgi:hypothetical protein